ncbi:type II secretory pathway, ATPase PulE/Tfp pilus assembly pathway, ATPase PilB [Desulfoscipio gibsoniae DSM 7213]|uniref:Type II secretory pathway, ATPase PulE/Tfp pilus assembly pathway, ATPase PilB n=1 Tax=Desulfoscipio gibsoniae DSM 7213 TaxID=767817 RepID=R4KHJ1_9FIRM|nr:type II secretory pathway, ATPase PulE/Tfp pilus assembly pathway, ATPase PilB [Desulfoscipio gibsoniae DSM 7213]
MGTCLVKEGVISQEQLDQALEKQKASPNKEDSLSKILVRDGHCTEDDIARVTAKRAGGSYITLDSITIDPAAVATMPVTAFKKYKALPVAFDGDKLVVAMKYPDNIVAIDDLQIMTGFDIKPVVVPDSELEAAIEKYSRVGLDFEYLNDEEQQEENINIETDDQTSRPAVQIAHMILDQAVGSRASDIHIEPYETYLRVRFRIDGVMHDMMQLPRKIHASLVSRIKIMASMNIAERRIPQDGRMSLTIEGKPIDARVASLPASFGERLTLRLLDRSAKIISLEELGMAPEMLRRYRQVLDLPYGCILATGPTGSGKSTTLFASLATLDKVAKNVITVEDPVEYRMESVNQVQINTRAGLTFASGLRSILRSDPDIIMVGEIRDQETAKLAIESALTGHLVFSTLHTNDAAGAVSRLTEMGIEPFLTSSALACVLAQRLARVLCPNCKEPYEIDRRQLERVSGFPLAENETRVKLYRPVGCMRCGNTGFKGRIGIYELLFNTETIQKMALERKSASDIKKAAIAEGMVTLRQDGLDKVKKGITSLEEIMRVIV